MSSNPTLEQRVASLEQWRESQVGGISAPVVIFTPRAGWYRPTDLERSSFAARYGAAASIDGVQVSIEPLAAGDMAGAFARAALGFDAQGKRGVWDANGLAVSRAYCDRIYDPHATAASREEMLVGASSLDPDGEALCVMTGYATFPGLGGSGHVGIGGATNAAEVVAAQLAQHQSGGGPSGKGA